MPMRSRMIGGLVILSAACAGWAVTLNASDPVGVYAVVEKIVLEPSDAAPQRIQIWGAFSLAEKHNNDDYGPAAARLPLLLVPGGAGQRLPE